MNCSLLRLDCISSAPRAPHMGGQQQPQLCQTLKRNSSSTFPLLIFNCYTYSVCLFIFCLILGLGLDCMSSALRAPHMGGQQQPQLCQTLKRSSSSTLLILILNRYICSVCLFVCLFVCLTWHGID